MAKKNKMPMFLYVIRDAEGTLLADDDYGNMEDGDSVAIYELVKLAKISRPASLTAIVRVPRVKKK